MIKYYYCETFGPFHKCGSSLILCKNFNAKSRQNRVNTKNTLLRYTVCNMCTSYHRGTDCNHSLSKRSTLVCKRYVCKNEPIHIISWSNCRLDLESKFWASDLSQICLLRPQSWDGDGRRENYMRPQRKSQSKPKWWLIVIRKCLNLIFISISWSSCEVGVKPESRGANITTPTVGG